MIQTREEAETHLATLRPNALRAVLETRQSIQLTQEICKGKHNNLIKKLRRETLQYITQVKREERIWKERLTQDCWE